jgi:hypothetical protein
MEHIEKVRTTMRMLQDKLEFGRVTDLNKITSVMWRRKGTTEWYALYKNNLNALYIVLDCKPYMLFRLCFAMPIKETVNFEIEED